MKSRMILKYPIIALLSVLSISNSWAESTLRPYTATYTSSYSGISADMEQTLKKVGAQQWQLRNLVSIMLIGFEEKAQFSEINGQLTPYSYRYDNQLSSKRSSALRFDKQKGTVIDTAHSQHPQKHPDGALDSLGFQAQLRLDVLNTGTQFTEKTYYLVDRTKFKQYTVKKLGEETIKTPAGTFNTIKLEQRRPGKEKHTLIWLAKDWDYFVLRIQRIEDGSSNYQVDLKQARLDGKKIRGL